MLSAVMHVAIRMTLLGKNWSRWSLLFGNGHLKCRPRVIQVSRSYLSKRARHSGSIVSELPTCLKRRPFVGLRRSRVRPNQSVFLNSKPALHMRPMAVSQNIPLEPLPSHSTRGFARLFRTKTLGNLRGSMPAQIKQLAIRIETGRAFETECVAIEDGPHKLAHDKISADVLKVVAPLVMSRELTIAIDGREVPFFIAACSAELYQAMASWFKICKPRSVAEKVTMMPGFSKCIAAVRAATIPMATARMHSSKTVAGLLGELEDVMLK